MIDATFQPIAFWEALQVTFGTANVDVVVPHSLKVALFHRVRFVVDDATAGGVVYRSPRAAGDDYIVLRASVAGRYRVILFTESQDETLQGI